MFCDSCGKKIPDTTEFCPYCGNDVRIDFDDTPQPPVAPVVTRAQVQRPQQTTQQAVPRTAPKPQQASTPKVNAGSVRPQQSAPSQTASSIRTSSSKSAPGGGMVLADGEQPVKQYHCSTLDVPVSTDGYITVTNKRLIFHAYSSGTMGSRVTKEVTLSKITGLDCFYGTNLSVPKLIAGILCAILALTVLFSRVNSSASGFLRMFFSSAMLIIVKLIVTAVLGYIAYRLIKGCLKKCFKMRIFASECGESPISIGDGPAGVLGSKALFSVVASPTKETDLMLNELGALVHDLQSMGDLAVSKWRNH